MLFSRVLAFFTLFQRLFSWLAFPYTLYELQLVEITHDEKRCCDIARLYLKNRETYIKRPLQKLARQKKLMERLHPLEGLLLEIVAAEERLMRGESTEFDQLIGFFTNFACVRETFFSERIGRNMLVLDIDEGGHQVCLSVKELINHREYLEYLTSFVDNRQLS